jgi:cob(I)alamin adenosyltransferase
MGEGWSWTRKPGTDDDHAANAAEGWEQVQRDLAAQTYRFSSRRVHLPDDVGLDRRRGGRAGAARPARDQHVVITGRGARPRSSRPPTSC